MATNVAAVDPVDTVAVPGTVTAVLLLVIETATPPSGAVRVSLTVQSAAPPPGSVVGVHARDAICTCVVTITDVDCEEPLYAAVIDAV